MSILPPSLPGNLGDIKVVLVTAQILEKPIIMLDYETDSWKSLVPDAKSSPQFGNIDCMAYFHVKGLKKVWFIVRNLLHLAWNIPHVIQALAQSKKLIILGMDVMGGHYGLLSALHKIALAYIAALLGTRVSIINCSFNKHPSRLAVFALRNLPSSVQIVAREPLSRARMQKWLKRPILLSADIAFLYSPEPHAHNSLQQHLDWIRSEKERGQTIVGINIADNKDSRKMPLIELFTETIRKMPNVSFVLIPHSKFHKDYLTDETRVLRSLLSHISEEEQKRCTMIDLPCDLPDLFGVLEQLDFAIVGRMHLAIGLLSLGVPAACLTYQNKFDGLFIDYLHMPMLLLDIQESMSDGNFVRALSQLLPQRENMRSEILRVLPILKELAMNNFELQTTVTTALSTGRTGEKVATIA